MRKNKVTKHLLIEEVTKLLNRTDIYILSDEYQRIAESTGYSLSSVKTEYYRQKGNQEEQHMIEQKNVIDVDDRINKHLTETSLTRDSFKVGDFVQCKIVNITEVGAYAQVEGYYRDILIPNVNISPTDYVEDASHYLKVNDIWEAEVVQGRGKYQYSLSLVHHNLTRGKEYHLAPNQLSKLRSLKLESVETSSLPDDKKTTNESTSNHPYERDLKLVYEFMQQVTGVVSDDAKAVIERLIEQYGVFPIAINLPEVKNSFKVDMSLFFAKALEEAVKKGSL